MAMSSLNFVLIYDQLPSTLRYTLSEVLSVLLTEVLKQLIILDTTIFKINVNKEFEFKKLVGRQAPVSKLELLGCFS